MSTLTPHAKAIIAAVFAVFMSGVTAYQAVDTGHFRPIDAVPVAVAVIAALQTKVVNNLGLPWAKAAINLGAAVVTAVAVVTADPATVSVPKIAVAALGAFLVWFVPEAGPLVAQATPLGDATLDELLDGPKHAAPSVTVHLKADTSQVAAQLAATTEQLLADLPPSGMSISDTQPFLPIPDEPAAPVSAPAEPIQNA